MVFLIPGIQVMDEECSPEFADKVETGIKRRKKLCGKHVIILK